MIRRFSFAFVCLLCQAARLDLATGKDRMLCLQEEWYPSHSAAASLPSSWVAAQVDESCGACNLPEHWPGVLPPCWVPCWQPSRPLIWKHYSPSWSGLCCVSSGLAPCQVLAPSWGRLFFTLTPSNRCTLRPASQGRICSHLGPATSLRGRGGEQTQRGTWLAHGHMSAGFMTEPRREHFLTPSSCLLNLLCLQGSHGLTLGGAPKARSRWEPKLLTSQAGRC